ncbi:MAG: hypothetical protein NC489_08980 [Ruminococcus flavefaciens]|nr:hypothetical protein [Ruminococcus flavefaciens]
MLIANMEPKSELYNTLAELGAISTEGRRFKEARASFNEQFVREYPLLTDDIERVGYQNPHFRLDIGETGIFEVWVNGEYINHDEITWIQGRVHLFGVLPREYDPATSTVRIVHNKYAYEQYSHIEEEAGEYEHVYIANLIDPPFCYMEHPDKAVYYIASGKICMPKVTRLSEHTIEFRCPYTKDIDMIVCSNLAGVFQVKANKGTYIDNLYSTICYYHMFVEDDPNYPIDARFYPCIKVDRDCTVRVFSDQGVLIPHPELTRLLAYPEFMDITDPYNTDNEYLNGLKDVDELILASDSDEVILEKFKKIAPYCYRIYERFPTFSNEQTDFLILDNAEFGKPNFFTSTIKMADGTSQEVIISRVPFEDYRDVLWYGNYMFHDYKVVRLMKGPDGTVFEHPREGIPTYVIDPKYQPDRFTLIKFNAMEDTVISNIGDYIDYDNMVKLHTKLNRFYRNMLILRGDVMDEIPGDAVRVSTTPPSEPDEHLWFELLVNAVPEMFESNPVNIIKSFGLNPFDIPEELRVGAYSLNLNPDDGPASYTKLMMTYFNLAKRHQQYLMMQSGDGVPDPRIQEFHEIIHGPIDNDHEHELNKLHIDNPALKKPESITGFEDSIIDPPSEFPKRNEGDVMMYHEPTDDDFDEIFEGVNEEKFSLAPISYMDQETGKVIDGDTIAAMTLDQKKELILQYITEGTDAEKENTKAIWDYYLATMDEEILNIAVYKVLLTDFVFNLGLDHMKPVDTEIKETKADYRIQMDEPTDVNIGTYWLQLEGNESPIVIDDAKKKNLTYIFSLGEPDVTEVGTFWINIPGITMQDYVQDIISGSLIEIGYNLPEGFYHHGEHDDEATMVFDYHAHNHGEGAPIFDEVKDESLHKIHYGELFDGEPEDGDIWFEFLDEIDNRVCYSDVASMVIRVDERLMMLEFDNNNITAFMFDDIVLNFHGRLGIRYIAILADLINSKVIDLKDVNIFYRRLITGWDHFDPGLERLYTGRSHVVSTARIDTTDYSIAYSTNIGRYHMDYFDEKGVINREREAAYRMVIDYSHRDFGFIGDRMMLFVNGRYIPRNEYDEIAAGKIQLLDFHEIIHCVDVIYAKKDTGISKIKRIAIENWGAPDTSVSIQRPKKNYKHMKRIDVHEKTAQGYYDVLLREYIFNGRLMGILNHMQEHPEEADTIIRDLKRKFHAICDTSMAGMDIDDARIVIPGLGDGFRYEIKEDKS